MSHHVAAEYAQVCLIDQQHWEKAQAVFSHSLSPALRRLNRYSDILALDATLYPPAGGPYICGNLVKKELFNVEHDFVMSQAPIPDGFADFWQAVADSGTTLIMMVTQLVESGVPKAEQYWPDYVGKPMAFGDALSVTKTGEEHDHELDTVVRHFTLSTGAEVKMVQYRGWPDRGVPHSGKSFTGLLAHIAAAPTTAPVFVHCSAGIGRSGTLIAVYIASQLHRRGQLGSEGAAVVDIVGGLKQCRHGAVQKREQYAFIYKCVDHFSAAK
jgi:protein tyrosine phosphatase